MAFTVRRRNERGHFDHGWLDTFHTFSFGHYFDPEWSQFRALRVMNEDVVAPGQGFGTHGHRDMEILTWVLDGALEHRDSLGHGEVLRPGEMQWMSAGAGIQHSEFNPSRFEATHLYQIWLLPREKGLEPTYAQRAFPQEGRHNRFQVLAEPEGRDGALPIRQDAIVSVANLDTGSTVAAPTNVGRNGWLQVLRGDVQTLGQRLTAGDGVALQSVDSLTIQAMKPSEVLFFDLA